MSLTIWYIRIRVDKQIYTFIIWSIIRAALTIVENDSINIIIHL